jgi:hypothetical protein
MTPKNFFQSLSWNLLILSSCAFCPLHAVDSNAAIGLTATSATQVKHLGERAKIARPLSAEEKMNIDKLRIKSIKDTFKAAKKLGINLEKKSKSLKPKGCFSSTNPNYKQASLHRIKTRSPKGELLEIENGAGFSVLDKWDMVTVQKWPVNSNIRIYSKGWGSSYDYQLYNEATKETVQANLSSAPYLYDPLNPAYLNPANSYLAASNPMTGDVALYGGAQYRVSSSYQDKTQLANWQQDDIIIVGDNDTSVDWFGCQYILINIATNSYVTADRLY